MDQDDYRELVREKEDYERTEEVRLNDLRHLIVEKLKLALLDGKKDVAAARLQLLSPAFDAAAVEALRAGNSDLAILLTMLPLLPTE